ncbi:MAG: hypothetical protein QM621_12230 [Aeromicrobium sp.]|uniref:hypothetical protein n=1 Tax=Aeromicrobium sp. TaxID=1871063 RepID=UPI0039E295F1
MTDPDEVSCREWKDGNDRLRDDIAEEMSFSEEARFGDDVIVFETEEGVLLATMDGEELDETPDVLDFTREEAD